VGKRVLVLPLLAVLAIPGCGFGVHFADYRHSLTSDATVSGPVKVVDVKSDSGRVSITPGGDEVRIHRVVHYEDDRPHPGQRLDAGTLTFTQDCSRCSVDYELTVPSSVAVRARGDSGRIDISGVATVDAHNDSGPIEVRSIKGAVRAHTDSGAVVVEDIGGSLDLATDSASIRAVRLSSATVQASSDSGSIRLAFATEPTGVHATTDSGSVRVAVPGGPYVVDARTDSGGTDLSGVPNDVSAPRSLFLRSDSGHLTAERATP
jgi:Putative adhesin